MKQSTRHGNQSAGFTIVELLVVLAILGIIAAVAIAAYWHQIDHARVAAVAGDLRTFETGFLSYASDTGDFPPDSHLDPPYHLPTGVGIEDYLPVTRWATPTPMGGNYNWEGPNNYSYAGVSLYQATVPASTLAMLDDRIDDGDLSQGRFRITPNGRYTYIIDE
jgi:prepilin-type N-terminal cleavage/methylation domain-containing protein